MILEIINSIELNLQANIKDEYLIEKLEIEIKNYCSNMKIYSQDHDLQAN